jgi:nucleoside-diphosphate-sugar epimerase
LSGIVFSWRTEFGDAFVGQRVLVTGATGFIGGHLCEALVALGAKVHGLGRSATPHNLVHGCQAWSVDLTDARATRSVISRIQPRFVYHLAGMVSARQEMELVWPTLQHNLVGTIHLLLALAEQGRGCLFVIGSSEELTADGPMSPYAAAKIAANTYARMFQKIYHLPLVMVRLFMTYGPRQASNKLIPYAILAFLRAENPRLSSGERICDFIYVLDVVRGLLRIGLQPNLVGQTFNLGTGQGHSIRHIVELLRALTGSRAHPIFGAIPDRSEEGSPVADGYALRHLLRWEPHWSLQVGLLETVAYYRKVQVKHANE